MLPVENISIVRARDLEPGDFAFVHDIDRPVVIGQDNDFSIAVILDLESDWPVCESVDLRGFATKIHGWSIELEPRGAEKLDTADDKILSLTLSRRGLGVVGLPPSKRGWTVVNLKEVEGPDEPHIYRKWRAVSRTGERVEELFAKTV
ncbi:hypothetical protein [Altericroceibacterium xinjiangense]|uniref:hypothetical protein n=1 Tax=Altericroceibacterium xinjiangense TaxID=762261 RepID=UPI000F7D978C|nr:hypothetical protein [Altericroceibacterium xinjiangense]